MTAVAAVLIVIFAIVLHWLWREGILLDPSVEDVGPINQTFRKAGSPAILGVAIFLAVVAVLFALLLSAYFMRVDHSELRRPWLLWFNTATLLASSAALHHSRRVAILEETKALVVLAAFLAFIFLAGQLAAWKQLSDSGIFADTSAAAAFFYLLTGAHGLHILGGLFAVIWVIVQFEEKTRLCRRIDLCATYWNFLLVVWLVIFTVLLGGADALAALCRNPLG